MIFDDENERDDGDDGDEYEGFAVTDDTGAEMDVERKKTKREKAAVWDDGETVEASPIPKNEQTVLLDKPSVADLADGTALTLCIDGETAAVYFKKEKAGELKPAFVKKLLEERAGFFARCVLVSASAPVMVKLFFSTEPGEGTVKI
jgi:hypothetical protein